MTFRIYGDSVKRGAQASSEKLAFEAQEVQESAKRHENFEASCDFILLWNLQKCFCY